MSYLSRIWLNPLRSGTQRLLRNPQAMHAAVLGGVPEQPVRQRVLWRLEPDGAHRVTLFVLTQTAPSWEHLVEQAGWLNSDNPQVETRPYERILNHVVLGREFALRLRANPVGATRHPQKASATQLNALAKRRGIVIAHRTAAQQTQWFLERLEAWGFRACETTAGDPDVRLVARDRLVFSKQGVDGARTQVTLSTATFEGHVRVTDVDRVQRSLLDGVGRAKAYGCGLITLALPSRLIEA